MFSPGSDWDIYSDWFDADIDGSFSCAYDPETGEINYMTKIRVGSLHTAKSASIWADIPV